MKRKFSRQNGGAKKRAKKVAKKTVKKATVWSPRKGGYVALTASSNQHGAVGRICQVVEINRAKSRIAVMYNYNGQVIVVKYDSVVKAPEDWKKRDPKNHNKERTNPLPLHIKNQLN